MKLLQRNITFYKYRFASPQVMYQYGLLLEDYMENGEFVNDCIFTMMHHVGGELNSLICLFQPNILKVFTSIWDSDFEICDVRTKYFIVDVFTYVQSLVYLF